MNVEIGTEAVQFLFWEYLFRIFCIVSLKCSEFYAFVHTFTLTDVVPNFFN
jgi:hypothetical protein